MKTTKDFQAALSTLLNQVRLENKWNESTFIKVANPSGLSKSEASRFYKALIEMQLIIYDKQRHGMVPQFDQNIWKNEDNKTMLIKEIMEMFPNLQQTRGRVKGKQYEVKTSLANYSPQELANELRKRGYEVSARRKIITVEEL
jgi:acyl transferase domain-containing protein